MLDQVLETFDVVPDYEPIAITNKDPVTELLEYRFEPDYQAAELDRDNYIYKFYYKIYGLGNYGGSVEKTFIFYKNQSDKDLEFYNFGNARLGDCFFVGNWDFGDEDEEPIQEPDSVAVDYDWDFNKLSEIEPDYNIFDEGDTIELAIPIPVYPRWNSKVPDGKKKGKYYIYSSIITNNRIRLCEEKNAVGAPGRQTGWFDVEDILSVDKIVVGDRVLCNGTIYTTPVGSGSSITMEDQPMWVRYIDEEYNYGYGLSYKPTSSIIGYASAEQIVEIYKIDNGYIHVVPVVHPVQEKKNST